VAYASREGINLFNILLENDWMLAEKALRKNPVADAIGSDN